MDLILAFSRLVHFWLMIIYMVKDTNVLCRWGEGDSRVRTDLPSDGSIVDHITSVLLRGDVQSQRDNQMATREIIQY